MDSTGKLIVSTYLANDAIPIDKSFITVTKSDENPPTLLGVRLTDKSGKTNAIEIDTPDVEYSLSPGNENIPFTSVDVRVDHPETYTVIVKNVQVFSGQTSISNVMLLPLPENPSPDERQKIYIITPQNL